MTELSDWRLYTVQDFFQYGYWLGVHLPSDRPTQTAHNWQCQTVEDFFQDHSWAGPLKTSRTSLSAHALTAPVGEYIRAIPWGGRPSIGHLPSIPTPTVSANVDRELNLSDLSNLF